MSTITLAARIVFVRVYAYPILLHVGQFYVAPSSVLKRIRASIVKFLKIQGKLPLAVLHAPVTSGGMSVELPDFSDVNEAAVVRNLYLEYSSVAGYKGTPERYGGHPMSPFSHLRMVLNKYSDHELQDFDKYHILPPPRHYLVNG